MDLQTIKAKFEAVNLKTGFIVAFREDKHGSTHVEIRRNDVLFWRAWSFEPDFNFDLNRAIELATESKTEDSLTRADTTVKTSDGNVRIITKAGMILIAPLSAVTVRTPTGIKCDRWKMRLVLIENLSYPASIQPDDIETIEYIA